MKKLLLLVFVSLAFVSPSECYATIAKGKFGTCKWEISDDGVLTIEPISGNEGTLDEWQHFNTPWFNYIADIKKAIFKGKIIAQTCNTFFYGCKNMTSVEGLSGFDTKDVRDMGLMFFDCTSLKSIDLSSFDTSNVTHMESVFVNCQSLESLDVSNFDTRNVKSIRYMFSDCSSLKSLDISNFDTSNIPDMYGLFTHCTSLTELNLTNFVTTDTDVTQMFNGCSKLMSIISDAVTPSSLNNKTFSSLPTFGKCELRCPAASVDAYKKADGWKNLIPVATGIDEMETPATQHTSPVFTTNGTSIPSPCNGINIIGGKKVIINSTR